MPTMWESALDLLPYRTCVWVCVRIRSRQERDKYTVLRFNDSRWYRHEESLQFVCVCSCEIYQDAVYLQSCRAIICREEGTSKWTTKPFTPLASHATPTTHALAALAALDALAALAAPSSQKAANDCTGYRASYKLARWPQETHFLVEKLVGMMVVVVVVVIVVVTVVSTSEDRTRLHDDRAVYDDRPPVVPLAGGNVRREDRLHDDRRREWQRHDDEHASPGVWRSVEGALLPTRARDRHTLARFDAGGERGGKCGHCGAMRGLC